MATGNKAELDDQAAIGMEEAAAWHTVGIICDGGKGVGTGVALKCGLRRVIVTAAHVVKDDEAQSLWFLFRPSGHLVGAELSEVPGHKHEIVVTPRERIAIGDVLRDDTLDLAFLVVSPQFEDTHRTKLFELKPGSATPPWEHLF